MSTDNPRYRSYPIYRDSGVDWLGEIPVHWEVKRLKQIGRLNSTFAP
jgi:type I restriction enzyme S subunit